MPSDQGGYFVAAAKEVDAAKKAETDLSIAMSRREEWQNSCAAIRWCRRRAIR